MSSYLGKSRAEDVPELKERPFAVWGGAIEATIWPEPKADKQGITPKP